MVNNYFATNLLFLGMNAIIILNKTMKRKHKNLQKQKPLSSVAAQVPAHPDINQNQIIE